MSHVAKKINWQLASIYELAVHISKSPNGGFRRQLNHYRSTNNQFMLNKIEEAKRIADALIKAINNELALKELQGLIPSKPFTEDIC